MNKEFIKDLYEWVDGHVERCSKAVLNKEGKLDTWEHERLLRYSFIKRILDSVIKPLETLIPETSELPETTETQNKN